jgi:hypothetical protein
VQFHCLILKLVYSTLAMKHEALTFSNEESRILSRLAEPWVAAALSEQVAKVQVADGTVVSITSKGVDVARCFECFRLAVDTDGGAVIGQPPAPFRVGAQSVRILQSEEWLTSENRPASELVGDYVGSHCSGVPGSAPVSAEERCIVDTGVLLVAPTTGRLLICCGSTPCWLRVIENDDKIELVLRNYRLRDLWPQS